MLPVECGWQTAVPWGVWPLHKARGRADGGGYLMMPNQTEQSCCTIISRGQVYVYLCVDSKSHQLIQYNYSRSKAADTDHNNNCKHASKVHAWIVHDHNRNKQFFIQNILGILISGDFRVNEEGGPKIEFLTKAKWEQSFHILGGSGRMPPGNFFDFEILTILVDMVLDKCGYL